MLLPDKLLRSIIRFSDEDEDLIAANLYMVRQEVEPQSIDGIILSFIGDMQDRTKSVPNYELVHLNFHEKRNEAATVRLEQLKEKISRNGNDLSAPAIGPMFRYQLDQFKKQLSTDLISQSLLDTSQILNGGLKAGNGFLEGPEQAAQFLTHKLSLLNTTLKRGSIEGSFKHDSGLVRKQYDNWKNNPADTVGVLTGIDKIDVQHRGARNGELVLVMGFVSHLKTTFCFNWLYKAAILFGRNVAIASLETPIEDMRIMLYVMHSSHQKFSNLGLPSLDYEKVIAGSLSTEEENLLDMVIEDMGNNPDYGEVFYKEPQDSLTIGEIQRWSESKHKTSPLDMIVIDYLGLVDPGKGVSSLDSGANLNKAIRQAKMMAMTFGNNRGIPVISPFQANREGLKEAEKNGGRYKLTALANANESERSTDKVYYVYLDDVLRNSRELVVGNLKNRRGPVIMDQFKVFANPSTRIIDNLDTAGAAASDLVEI